MGLGKKIAYYRKDRNITQDALAKQLGISNQAVSKWETEQSYPDVELLPKIADIFEITLDELFEREVVGQEKSDDLPWEDDGTLRAVLFIGHRLIQKDELKEKFERIGKEITFSYCGLALNVESSFSVSCDEVQGSVTAGSYVECDDVGEGITAGSYVECGDIGGSVTVGSYVECGDIGGSIAAGGYVECGDVGGNVTAGGYVECGDIGGCVSAEGNVNCGDVNGDVKASGSVECGDIGGCV